MSIMLSEAEVQYFEAMRAQAVQGQIGYWQIYKELANLLETKGVPQSDPVLLWLHGATEANAGRGAFSALIRTYTAEQYKLRYGIDIPSGKMQEASDGVAKNLLDDLSGISPGSTRGLMPDIARIAEADAFAVGLVLFNQNGADTASPQQVNAAWSGALLFTLLSSNQGFRLTSTGSSADAIDSVNDWRDVLFSYRAYRAGLKAAGVAYIADDPAQRGVDTGILGSTIVSYASASGQSFSDIWNAFPNPTATSPALKDAIKKIDAYGTEAMLDWLRASIDGTVPVPTTEGNFEARAYAFAQQIGTQGQQWSAQLETWDQLLSAAKGDGGSALAARNALKMLSPFAVSGSGIDLQSRGLDLVDPSTGTGDLSAAWLGDRAEMLNWLMQYDASGGGALRTAGSYSYDFSALKFNADDSDLVLHVTSKSNFADPQHIKIIFGSDGNDSINGMDVGIGDHLYGGGGNDTIKGAGGNDYIEGGDGDDELTGGTGNDVLAGGVGNEVNVGVENQFLSDICHRDEAQRIGHPIYCELA